MMHDHIMTKDRKLKDIIYDGPHVPMKVIKEGKTSQFSPKCKRDYKESDQEKIEKIFKDKKVLVVE